MRGADSRAAQDCGPQTVIAESDQRPSVRGVSVFKMRDVSRHKSIDVLQAYVRDADLFRNHAGTGLLRAMHNLTSALDYHTPVIRFMGELVMPLVRDHEQFEFERFDAVYFWMRDGANHVLCKVSHEALRERTARDGEDAMLMPSQEFFKSLLVFALCTPDQFPVVHNALRFRA